MLKLNFPYTKNIELQTWDFAWGSDKIVSIVGCRGVAQLEGRVVGSP